MLAHVQPKSRPNVLFIISDQHRADLVGYETPGVRTPNLDALAAAGIVCHRAYVQSPQCQPSRASIFTGRHPTAHKVWWNEIDMPKTERTLGNHLADAGYRTAYFGKLHFDGPERHDAIARHFGFQRSYLYQDWLNLVTSGESGKKRAAVANEFYGIMGKAAWTGRFTNRELHHEEVITARALNFLAERRAEPFLAVVGFHGPHPPYAAPDEFSRQYDDHDFGRPRQPVRTYSGHVLSDDEWHDLNVQYRGAVSWIDDCIGRLVGAVGPDTIVIYVSDHGDILGDHGLFSKGMFAYEGNTRVPLIIRLPDHRPLHHQHLVQSIDLVPTILEATGTSVPRSVQGKSLLSGFSNDEPTNQWVLSMIGHAPRLRMVRTTEHKYWLCGAEEKLFDVVNDPGETTNLIGDSSLASRMRLTLLRALIQAEDSMPSPRP